MTENIIEITDAAVAHIQKMLQKRSAGIGFRISVKQAGCTGYKYQPEIVEQVPVAHESLTTPQGLTIFIDRQCIAMIKGTVIDYVNKGLSQQLVFHNPNVDNECGCGESFYLKSTGNVTDNE